MYFFSLHVSVHGILHRHLRQCITIFFSVDGNCTKPVQQFVDPGMFEPFMQLVLKENEGVRQSMADNLSRLFSHVKIFHANGKQKSNAPNNL